MLKALIVFALVVAGAMAQEDGDATAAGHPAPEPYNFAFESTNDDGSSTARQETGDADGKITGFYIIKGLDGQDRRVDYYADETGFHAEVSTSEDGTISHEADQAIYKSSAGTLDEQIARWEKSAEARAAANAASAYRSTTSSTTSTTASGYGRAAAPTLNIGGGGAARQATRTETVRTTSTSTSGGGVGGVQVTPEGYVLVPASSARAAGIAGRQVSANTASNLGLPSTSGFRSTGRVSLTTAPLRSTTTVTRTQTSRTGSTNRAIGGISTAGGYSTTALDGGVQYQPVDGAEAIEEAN